MTAEYRRVFLIWILAATDSERANNADRMQRNPDHREWRIRAKQFEEHGVPYAPLEWLEREGFKITSSTSVQASRAINSLERDGLIEPCLGNRRSRVKLTVSGEEAARPLLEAARARAAEGKIEADQPVEAAPPRSLFYRRK